MERNRANFNKYINIYVYLNKDSYNDFFDIVCYVREARFRIFFGPLMVPTPCLKFVFLCMCFMFMYGACSLLQFCCFARILCRPGALYTMLDVKVLWLYFISWYLDFIRQAVRMGEGFQAVPVSFPVVHDEKLNTYLKGSFCSKQNEACRRILADAGLLKEIQLEAVYNLLVSCQGEDYVSNGWLQYYALDCSLYFWLYLSGFVE